MRYPYKKKGWHVYDIEIGEYFISRDVIFHENMFPYAEGMKHTSENNFRPSLAPEDVVIDDELGTMETALDRHEPLPNSENNIEEVRGIPRSGEETEEMDHGASSASENMEEMRESEAATENLGRGHCQPKAFVLLKDYVTYSARCLKDPIRAEPNSESRSSGTTLYPIANYVTCANFSARHRAFLAAINADPGPTRFLEAVRDEKW